MKRKASPIRLHLPAVLVFFLFAGPATLFSDEGVGKSGAETPKIVCKTRKGEIAKIRCKFSTQSVPHEREVTFTWRSPTSPSDDRKRTLVLPGGHRSVFDERYLYGRASGEWEISTMVEGVTTRVFYLLDDAKHFYLRQSATPEPYVEETKVREEHLWKKQRRATRQCDIEGVKIGLSENAAGETVLQIETAESSTKRPVGSGIYDATVNFEDASGNRYAAIRYKNAENGENAAVLATNCGGRLAVSNAVEGYIEKIGSDELYGIDTGVNTALCNTRPCTLCRSHKPAIYKIAGIGKKGILLQAYSVEKSVGLPLGKKKYREYFKQLRFNMSVALYGENLHLDDYLNRLPPGERSFCKALYEEEAFERLVPLYSEMAGNVHQ